jgi:hypothetical protein
MTMLYRQVRLALKIHPNGTTQEQIDAALTTALDPLLSKGLITGNTTAQLVDWRLSTDDATPEQVDELDEDDDSAYWEVEYALRDCGAGGAIYHTGKVRVDAYDATEAAQKARDWVNKNDPKADASIDYGIDVLTVHQYDEDDERCGADED